MLDFIEKRKFPRLKVAVPLRYKELWGKTYLARGVRTKNLSEGGVRFNTDRFISLSCHLIVEINLPLTSKPVKAISEIAWIKKRSRGDKYEVGIQFLAMTNEDETTMSDYVKKIIDSAS